MKFYIKFQKVCPRIFRQRFVLIESIYIHSIYCVSGTVHPASRMKQVIGAIVTREEVFGNTPTHKPEWRHLNKIERALYL